MKIKYTFFALITAVLSAAVNIPVKAENSQKMVIYVSDKGNDNSDGSVDKPLKTLEGARRKVKVLKENFDGIIEVLFREGEYRFSETVKFTAEDSGTEENQIVYRAYNNEKVEFKGSVELDASKGEKVTDKEILSRMYEKVQDKVLCFKLSGMGVTAGMLRQPGNTFSEKRLTNGEMNGIYVDGSQQILAQWPNGEGKYSRWKSTNNAKTMIYHETEPNRWGKAENFWLGGYPSYDYLSWRASVTDVDTDNKTITISGEKFTSYQSRRWKAFNLLEEIDIPGEYYIDTEKMLLYFYPPYPMRDARLEMDWLNTPIIEFTKASNIRFEGITFCQTRGNGAELTDIDNIDFLNCRFENIGYRGIDVSGSVRAYTDKDYWQSMRKDGSYNMDVTGCIFNNIGGSAIKMQGGNSDTLTPSGNVISDNIIYRANQLVMNESAIAPSGVGIKIVNNIISRCPFQAIRVFGNDHIIMYNEFHDVLQEGDDCGVIYQGRNTLQRGMEIAYNYFHDLHTTEKIPYGYQCAIYWDDSQTGMNAHHNIIRNARMDVLGNGATDFNYSYNTSVDIEYQAQRFGNGGYAVNNGAGAAATNYKLATSVWDMDLYYSHYPKLKEILATTSNDPKLARFNVIKNNLTVNAPSYAHGSNTESYGVVSGNVLVKECSDFVDPTKQDYRIKSDSETAKAIPGILTEDFDIELIGTVNDIELNEKTSPFRQISPANGERAVKTSQIDFVWENAFGASKYRLVIATDKELKNIVYDEVVPYSIHSVSGLGKNTVYYWKVYALNTSRDLNAEWESTSCVYSFSTAVFERLDTGYLNISLNNVSEELKTLEEGNAVGQYPVGTRLRIESLIKKANMLSNSKLGIVSQKTIDNMTVSLSDVFGRLGMVNKGYLDISEYIDDEAEWGGEYKKEDDGAITLESNGKQKMCGTKRLGRTTGSCVYSFDAMVNTSNWLFISLSKYIDMQPHAASNSGYGLCIKDNVIELQMSSGSQHSVLETVEKSFANDGKYHDIEFGFIDIGIGNYIILNVDGEPWIEYLDVINPAVKTNCELMMFVRNIEGEAVSIKPSETTSLPEQFSEQMHRGLLEAVKVVMEKFTSDEEVIIFEKDAKKIVSQKGVFDVSHAPNIMTEGKMMIAFDKVDDIFDIKTAEGNGKYYCINGGKTELTEVILQNGFVMVSAEEVMAAAGRSCVWSDAHGMLVAGNIIVMNNADWLDKESKIIEKLSEYEKKEDYLFDNYIGNK